MLLYEVFLGPCSNYYYVNFGVNLYPVIMIEFEIEIELSYGNDSPVIATPTLMTGLSSPSNKMFFLSPCGDYCPVVSIKKGM